MISKGLPGQPQAEEASKVNVPNVSSIPIGKPVTKSEDLKEVMRLAQNLER